MEFRSDRLVFEREGWVSVWYDPRQSVTTPAGTTTATRAITTWGCLLWLVRNLDRPDAYHSCCDDPFAAIAEVELAWCRQREQRLRMVEVERIARDLRFFRRRFNVQVADAYRSPLLDVGVDGFRKSVGIAPFQTCPGWVIGWLHWLDPRAGFVLSEAHRRQSHRPPDAGDRRPMAPSWSSLDCSQPDATKGKERPSPFREWKAARRHLALVE